MSADLKVTALESEIRKLRARNKKLRLDRNYWREQVVRLLTGKKAA